MNGTLSVYCLTFDDEYEFEIAKIVALLNKVNTVEALSDGIGMIFTKALDWNFTKEECLPIDKQIWREVKR